MKKLILLSIVLGLACLVGGTAFGAIIRVPDDYPTIQAGIDAASSGDTVLVADGTYTGRGNKWLNFHGKAITVRSENGPTNCIIDCEGWGHAFRFRNGESPRAIIDGLTIQNGYEVSQGGAIQCSASSPTITNCIFLRNSAYSSGGAIVNNGGSPNITNCTFSGNFVGVHGGAIFNTNSSSPTITNCIFWGNDGGTYGGGRNL